MTPEPTTTEVDVVKPNDGQLSERMKYAQALAAADLLPASYRRKPANVLLAMEYGHALGLDTITAIQQVHVVEGKPTASAQLIGGLVRRAGHRLRVTGDDKRAVAEIIRRDDPEFVFRSEWTMSRAQAAGLSGKSVWKQYPAAMLKARAITEVARDACPEALAGVAYTAEELGDEHATWSVETVATAPTSTPTPDPWTTSTPTIVADEETGEIIEEAEIVEPATPASGVPATERQLKAIGAILSKCGIRDHDERHLLVSRAIGRSVLSANELTKTEAGTVIETFSPIADSSDPDAALTDWMNTK